MKKNQAAQEHYDHLITMSDIAFQGVEDVLMQAAGLDTAWQEKAKAYEYSATRFSRMMACYFDVIVDEKVAKVRQAIQQEQQDEYETIKAA